MKSSNSLIFHLSYKILVGWGVAANQGNQGGFGEPPSAKSQALNLIRSIRTVAKSNLLQKYNIFYTN